MISSDFRQIALDREAGKGERLFRAAVSAFCSLTRPSRREIRQLEDLALPLFDQVSVESRRYVAAALSECDDPPRRLVRRLCDEPVEVAAPLLVRSKALGDVDLIALIARHGLAHARAIARRPDLNPALKDLVHALERPLRLAASRNEPAPADEPQPAAQTSAAPGRGIETMRERLRSLMLPVGPPDPLPIGHDGPTDPYPRLLETALTGRIALFQTALADLLNVDFQTAKAIAGADGYGSLLPALRSLDLGAEQSFVVTAAVLPLVFSHPEAIRLFLDRYRSLRHDTALARVHRWKTEASPTEPDAPLSPVPANAPGERPPAENRRSIA